MPRQTLIRAVMPDPGGQGDVEELWTILTHEGKHDWWSEVLDEHRHPHVHADEYGYDTVRKFFGDSAEEARREALDFLEKLVRERGGRLETISKTQEI